eukprot:scaffold2460_cov109-Isochrysis_galbana.AAC.6
MFTVSPVLSARTVTHHRPSGEAAPFSKRGRGDVCWSNAVVTIGQLPHGTLALDDGASGLDIFASAAGVAIDASGLICASADASS